MGIIIRSRTRTWPIVIFIIAFVFALITYLINGSPAKAETVLSNWSWTNSHPLVAESTPVDDLAGQYCVGTYQSIEITGIGTKWVCVVQGDGVSVGTYDDGRTFRTIVSFTYDTKMYPVYGTGSCEQKGGCIYIPESDSFATKQNLINNIVRSLVIYREFKQRLVKITDKFGTTTGYTFNSLNPDYTFKSTAGYAWPVEGLGASDDGTWLAVEFRQRGVGVLNMNNYKMKRISTISPTYGAGRDPVIEFSITNNGQHVAMMGSNYGGVTLYDVNSQCGDEATDNNMQYIIPVAVSCKKINVNPATFINKFFTALNPQFDSEGGELTFFAKSSAGASRAVALRATGYEPQRLDYLALGDSFTSGEGETEDAYYQPGTNDEFEKCHLSKRSYPYLIATSLSIEPQYVRSVACSGATTKDIVGNDNGYWGQGGRLSETGLNFNIITKSVYQAAAKESLTPGRVHQLRFVEKYKPKIITIGIGGNDVGFMEKLKSCVGPSTCEWAETTEGREKTALEVKRAFTTLANTYTAIRSASPKSRIYVFGYPKIIDASGQCGLLSGILLNTTERTFMNEGIIYINQVIEAAAKKAGVKYIDIEDSFGNMVLCGAKRPSVMNAIALGDDDTPLSVLGWLKIIGKESFHPQPSGHVLITSKVQQSAVNLQSYDYCLDVYAIQNNMCESTGTSAPLPSNYWLENGIEHNYDSLRIADFVSDSADITDIQQKSIKLPAYTFASNSDVQAELHSTPIKLASSSTDSDGGVAFDVKLPIDLDQGFHTIHLFGTSYSGEKIDLYQVIKYLLPSTDEPNIDQASNTDNPTQTTLNEPKMQSVDVTTPRNTTNSGQTLALDGQTELESQSIVNTIAAPQVLGQTTGSPSQPEANLNVIWIIGVVLVSMSAGSIALYRLTRKPN